MELTEIQGAKSPQRKRSWRKSAEKWLDHFDMKLHHIHPWGHARAEDICTIIQRINQKKLMSVHTEHPDTFNGLVGKVKSSRSIDEPTWNIGSKLCVKRKCNQCPVNAYCNTTKEITFKENVIIWNKT